MEETDNICFVCDQTIPLEKWKYQLQVTATKRRNAPVADLIQDLVGDEFEVLVGERDAICSKCMNLLNLMDSLTFQLGEVKSTLTQLLHSKYNLTSENSQLQVEYDDTTLEEKEPLHKCDFCSFQTKYEKEFNKHIRTHPIPKLVKSPVIQLVKLDIPYHLNSVGEVPARTKKKATSKISRKAKKPIGKKKKSPKKSLKKTPKTAKKKTKNVPKQKKRKIVFQCGVCDKVYPSEDEIRLHCKKQHGNDKIVVSDEEEFEDLQTLESSDEELTLLNEVQKKPTKRNNAVTKKKLDFLDDWEEDEVNDDLHSPPKKQKIDKPEEETTLGKQSKHVIMANLFRSSLRKSFDDFDEDGSDEKDTSSQPTCMFCKSKFSSIEAVQDHIKMSHRDRPNLAKSKTTTAAASSVGSLEIDSTTDIAESRNQAGVTRKKHRKQKNYKCVLCGIKKVSLKFIKQHIKAHKRKLSLQCKKCGIAFKKVVALKVHSYKCHKVVSVFKKCRQCTFKFPNPIQLKNHIKKVHSHKPKMVGSSRNKKSNNVSIKKTGKKTVPKSVNLQPTKLNEKSEVSKTDISNISVSEVSSTSIETDIKQQKVVKTKYKCAECNIYFTKPSMLQTHFLRHTSSNCSNLGICVFCQKLFLTKEQLVIHNNTVHEPFKVQPKCSVCNKTYSLTKDLRIHYLRCHFGETADKFVKLVSEHKNSVASLENDVYNKVFKELQDLTGEGNDMEDLPASNNLSPLMYSCPICDFDSRDQDELKKHLSSHAHHYCNICENILSSEDVIKHIENHTIDFQGLKCSVCDREFHDNIHLQSHILSVHPRQKTFKCSMCEKAYLTEKSMIGHKQSKHGQETKKAFSCVKCKKDFFSEKQYQTHIEYSHRLGLNCKYCDKALDSTKLLILHEKNHLKRVKSINKCNTCGKVLKSKQTLKIHRSFRCSRNPLVCEVCNTKFKSYHTLREHSAKHSGVQEKKYFCEICGKGFYFYDSHTRHRRLHLDPLLFQCKKCKERFQTKQKLEDHKKTCNLK